MPAQKRKGGSAAAGNANGHSSSKAGSNKAKKARSSQAAQDVSYDPAYESLDDDDEGSEGGFVDLEAEGALDSDEGAAGLYEDGEEDDSEMEGGFEDLEAEGEDGDMIEEDEEEEEEEGAQGSQKRVKAAPPARFAIPSNQEMQDLRETGELFKNNVLKLQVSVT